jgi:hypothetical protein
VSWSAVVILVWIGGVGWFAHEARDDHASVGEMLLLPAWPLVLVTWCLLYWWQDGRWPWQHNRPRLIRYGDLRWWQRGEREPRITDPNHPDHKFQRTARP